MDPNVRHSSRAVPLPISQMQSYHSHIAGQAGPDSPYHSGSTPQHLAKIAPVSRSGGATEPATSPLNQVISAYDSPYTAATGSVASPPIGASTRAASPPLMTTGPSASPLIESKTRPTTPALFLGSDSIPSSPLHSTSRSPSPDAEKLISSLANYRSLSDDALYDAALNAQQAMVKWQDEYIILDREINFWRESSKNGKAKRKNPRKLEDPEEYDRKHHEFLHQPTLNIAQTTGNRPQNTARPRAINPINKPASTGRGPRNELHIDMNEAMQPVAGKRIRKPHIIDNGDAAVPTPKNPTKRAREPTDADPNTPLPDQPPAKKQTRHYRSITPPEWVRTARTIKSESEEPSAAPEKAPKKGRGPAKGVAETVVKEEPVGEEKGKDPVRAAAARLMWAKRRAKGTNGRHGGAPKGRKGVKVEEK